MPKAKTDELEQERRKKIASKLQGAKHNYHSKSEFKKGHKHSEKIKMKLREANKGKIISDLTRQKISERLKGKMPKNIPKPRYGADSNLWKGGITPLLLFLRTCFEYRQWRSDVFTRDNFICQECGVKGGKLNADHIKPFSIIIHENKIKTYEEAKNCEELWNINNGRTFCEDCHKKTPTYGVRKITKIL